MKTAIFRGGRSTIGIMGKPKKKGKGGEGDGSGGGGKRKPGRRELQRQRQDNERKAEAALAAYMSKLGITEDSDLFAPLSPKEDCPICLVPRPAVSDHEAYLACCGNFVCCACKDASMDTLVQTNALRAAKKQPPLPPSCAFCREKIPSTEDYAQLLKERIEVRDDATAMFGLFQDYREVGSSEKDERKAFDVLIRAVELGSAKALNRLALEYHLGELVRKDRVLQRACAEASAKGGSVEAHYNLGCTEFHNRNVQLAVKHYHVAAAAGYQDALTRIKEMCQGKLATNEDYLRACRAYQIASADQSSDERKKWAEKKKKKAQAKTI